MLCTIASTRSTSYNCWHFLICPYAYKSSLDPLTQFSVATDIYMFSHVVGWRARRHERRNKTNINVNRSSGISALSPVLTTWFPRRTRTRGIMGPRGVTTKPGTPDRRTVFFRLSTAESKRAWTGRRREMGSPIRGCSHGRRRVVRWQGRWHIYGRWWRWH
jgi:hypothetical protein